ncbi:hypothetical protein L9F63_010535, partial [Diploptera punctata]
QYESYLYLTLLINLIRVGLMRRVTGKMGNSDMFLRRLHRIHHEHHLPYRYDNANSVSLHFYSDLYRLSQFGGSVLRAQNTISMHAPSI